MKANEWVKRIDLEDAFNVMHKVKPKVEMFKINSSNYKVKLKYQDSEIIIEEKMKNGLTDYVLVQCGSDIKRFSNYFEAEKAASKLLKEKKWPT